MPILRQRQPAPALGTPRSERVTVRHPWYDGVAGDLLDLLAHDGGGGGEVIGVDYQLVYCACALVTGADDLWLSPARDPGRRRDTTTPDPDILEHGTYYLHLPPPSSANDNDASSACPPNAIWQYPVIPSFRHWAFPHDHIPTLFLAAAAPPYHQASSTTPTILQIRARDQSCHLTNHQEGSEYAHVIPVNEKEWFAANSMDRYRTVGPKIGQDVVDAACNGILLREDVHTHWDRWRWLVFPKFDRDRQPTFVAHVSETSAELHALYHNLSLHTLRGIPPEYIYARFAMHIFPQLRAFLQRRRPRWLKVRHEDGQVREREYSAEECEGFADAWRSRSVSPSKRRRGGEGSTAPTSVQGASSTRSFDSAVSGLRPERSARASSCESDEVSQHRDEEEEANNNDEGDEKGEGEDDPYGCRHRRRQELQDQAGEDDPSGYKRRRRQALLEQAEEQDAAFSGRWRRHKRRRSGSSIGFGEGDNAEDVWLKKAEQQRGRKRTRG